tara:strand:- start:8236 stop:8451 length:216 start_codon:yes stop_codon:yes gene_type:complete
MKTDCTKLGNTYTIEFFGNLEENFYSFEVFANLDTDRDIVFIDPSEDLNNFFKKKVAEVLNARGRKNIVFE